MRPRPDVVLGLRKEGEGTARGARRIGERHHHSLFRQLWLLFLFCLNAT